MFIDTLGMFHPTKYNNLEYVIFALYKEATRAVAMRGISRANPVEFQDAFCAWRESWSDEKEQAALREIKKQLKTGIKFGIVEFGDIEIDFTGLDFSDPKGFKSDSFDAKYGPEIAMGAINNIKRNQLLINKLARDIIVAIDHFLNKEAKQARKAKAQIENAELYAAVMESNDNPDNYEKLGDEVIALQKATQAIADKRAAKKSLKFDEIELSYGIIKMPLDLSDPFEIDTRNFNSHYQDIFPINTETNTGLAEHIFATVGIVSKQQRYVISKEAASPKDGGLLSLRKHLSSLSIGNGSSNSSSSPSSPKSSTSPKRLGSPPMSPMLLGARAASPLTPRNKQYRPASPAALKPPQRSLSTNSLLTLFTNKRDDDTSSPTLVNSPRGADTSGLRRSHSVGTKKTFKG